MTSPVEIYNKKSPCLWRQGVREVTPFGETLSIYLVSELATFHNLRAPTFDVDVRKSPEILSIQQMSEIFRFSLSNCILHSLVSREFKRILPSK